MAKPSSLDTLIELAQENADEAGKQLQLLSTERKNAEDQLKMLLEYRQDYAARLQAATESGLSASNYHNFRQFIATLDEAISQQNKVVAHIDVKMESGRQRWYAEKRRLSSFETLRTRHARQQAVRDNRAEQLASDEMSAIMHRRVRRNH
ncbi:flagellar export protein FliJ [Parapusillimonas granuli]|uniref:Flagellar FliJ protein n=1 Tax=Parapusillimonas granuli TaxID=380911 RepID=A0A853G864_9BURK|nr:flagellar export protein FliJ [Parapusillimonas granuli]MBB5213377.1 flagellar FliJ protein [Parapusillimonas granuli]MEB2398477.1 flagellar export protein FliJ [Alcaligenaceae bacterium]NYT51932.1 flagellar export protein FliJ [Parapusillimonas granuli]